MAAEQVGTMRIKRFILSFSLVVGIGIAAGLLSHPADSQTSVAVDSIADAQGNLHVPAEYRTIYQYLGTWAVAAKQAAGSEEIHTVYASPGVIDEYQKTGKFPEGAVLVKEVFQAKTDRMTTGTVSREDRLEGWFVMVKSSTDKFPENKLWGDGWGWSWFDADNPTKTTSTNYRADCQGCHIPAKSTDWIYVRGYPPLSK
ncbi:cytochrome P460 family protein [Ancylobacter dichloromethanicus]|nr:cytochrome P460 family protein [Ancylobacter dichloromethanicus]